MELNGGGKAVDGDGERIVQERICIGYGGDRQEWAAMARLRGSDRG